MSQYFYGLHWAIFKVNNKIYKCIIFCIFFFIKLESADPHTQMETIFNSITYALMVN